jgi:DNA (cytosine-5)-methyltransferase 1
VQISATGNWNLSLNRNIGSGFTLSASRMAERFAGRRIRNVTTAPSVDTARTTKTDSMGNDNRPTSIDLFAGVGGMSLGFEQAGFDVVAAFDSEERHVQTYRSNSPSTQAHVLDLSKATAKEIRRLSGIRNRTIDVLFGGPPCQGFSVGGRRDLNDVRNTLVLHFARLIRELRPRYFVMENVEGLLLDHAAPILRSFCLRVKRAKYDIVEPIRVLDAANFGVPQRRRRTFVLGCRRGLLPPKYPKRCGIANGNGEPYFPTVEDAIGDLPEIELFDELFECDELTAELGEPSYYASLMRGEIREPDDRSHKRGVTAGVLTGCLRTAHSATTIKRFRKTRPGRVEPVSRYYRLAMDGVARTIRAGTNVDRGKHTAPRPIHPEKPRCITVREAARLHSFPDWFQFHHTRWHGFRQIGNSVPPRLARAVARAIKEALDQPTFH